MIQLVIGGVILYYFFKNKEEAEDDSPTLDEPQDEPTQPTPTPEGGTPTSNWESIYRWSGEASFSGEGGDNIVWVYETGIRFDDGTEDWDRSDFIVIGNANHTAFLRANSNRGTIDIPKEATGGTKDMDNVVVFPDLATAEARADELSNPEPADPNDPTQPQAPPEDDDDNDDGGGRPSFPNAPPSFPSFGGETSYGF